MQKITPFFWFDKQAEEAINFYVSIFKNSKIGKTARYDKASAVVSGQKEGTVMTVSFQLEGQDFIALNGGPVFKFSQATSFVIDCKNQEEVDHYWNKLSEGGEIQQCGWLIDKFGLAWQVVPAQLNQLLSDPNPSKAQNVMKAMLQMKKLDVSTLQKAYDEA